MGGSESCIQTINVIDVVGRNDITSVFFVRSMKSVRQSGTEKHPPLLLTKRMEKERKKERKKEGRKEWVDANWATDFWEMLSLLTTRVQRYWLRSYYPGITFRLVKFIVAIHAIHDMVMVSVIL